VARAPTVDVGSSSTGNNITSDFTRRVPVATPGAKGSSNRSFEAVAEVTPGAQTDTYGVSIAGTSSPENGYMVDGLSVGNPSNGTIGTPLSSEFVKEVNVISGGYLPEYGRSMGGVLNAITKTGSNEFHGGAFSYFTPGGLAGTPKLVRQPIDSVVGTSPLSSIYDIGADVGGPIIKDKLWFYVGFDYSQQRYDVNRTFWHQVYDPSANGGRGGVLIDPSTGNPLTQQINGMDQHYRASAQSIQTIREPQLRREREQQDLGVVHRGADDDRRPRLVQRQSADGRPGDGPLGVQRHLPRARPPAQQRLVRQLPQVVDRVRQQAHPHRLRGRLAPPVQRRAAGRWESARRRGICRVPQRLVEPLLARLPRLPDFEPGFDAACQSPNPARVNTLCPLTSYTTGGPTGRIEQQTFNRYTVGSTLTYLFQGLGHHVAKAGFSVEYTTWDHIKAHSGGASILEDTGGALSDSEHFGVLRGPDNPSFLEPFRVKTTSIIGGGFVQDSWSVMDKFTINAGMRYDVQSLYGSNGQLGLTMPNEWSPRIGVIYDPTQEGHSKLFGNFARVLRERPARHRRREPHRGAQRPRDLQLPVQRRRRQPAALLPEQRLASQRQRSVFSLAKVGHLRRRRHADRPEHPAHLVERGRLRRRVRALQG